MINKVYSKLFLSSFMQYFVLSITGMVDCAVCGRWCGTDGLTAMQLGIKLIYAASDKIDYTSALDLNNICIHIMRQEGEQYVINK